MKIVIIDYGMGNIKSIIGALKYLKADNIVLSNDIEEIKSADKLILPGVGSFAEAMANIKKLNLEEVLHQLVMEEKKADTWNLSGYAANGKIQ